MTTAAERDMAAWKKWKRIRSPGNLEAVLHNLNPVIQHEVNRWSGTLARPVIELEAKRLAVEAIKSYRPGAGAALATHVVNRLKKLSRLSYTHQNLARAPEYQALKFHTYTSAQAQLEDDLGREPTASEMADHLGWSRGGLAAFQKNLRKEFMESGEDVPIFDGDSGESGMVDYVYHDLSPIQKKIFEHTTGYGGAEELSNPKLMKRLGLTQGQLSYQKRLMTNKIDQIMSGRKW